MITILRLTSRSTAFLTLAVVINACSLETSTPGFELRSTDAPMQVKNDPILIEKGDMFMSFPLTATYTNTASHDVYIEFCEPTVPMHHFEIWEDDAWEYFYGPVCSSGDEPHQLAPGETYDIDMEVRQVYQVHDPRHGTAFGEMWAAPIDDHFRLILSVYQDYDRTAYRFANPLPESLRFSNAFRIRDR